MAISPPSDVVLDVARAAEPSALEAAKARLERAARANAKGAGSFASAMAETSENRGTASRKAPETFVKFEAMVLQTFLQSILPKDTETVYGGGMAGEMWKSLLAEKLGEVMAERGGIGIADRVLGDYYLEGEKKVPVAGVSQGPDKENADKQATLSTALVEELQRSFIKAIGEDHSGASATAERRR